MTLELYYFEACPFCQKVMNFLNTKKHNIVFKDTCKDKTFLNELKKISGKTQVPCLVIDGKPMLESDLIIEYLENILD